MFKGWKTCGMSIAPGPELKKAISALPAIFKSSVTADGVEIKVGLCEIHLSDDGKGICIATTSIDGKQSGGTNRFPLAASERFILGVYWDAKYSALVLLGKEAPRNLRLAAKAFVDEFGTGDVSITESTAMKNQPLSLADTDLSSSDASAN